MTQDTVVVTRSARDAAEQFRRGTGGKYDRDVDRLTDAIAAAEQRGFKLCQGRAAREGYRVCAETRHVTLGDKVRDAIEALSIKETGNGE